VFTALASWSQVLLPLTAGGELGGREVVDSKEMLPQFPPSFTGGGSGSEVVIILIQRSSVTTNGEDFILARSCLIRPCAAANGLIHHFYEASNEAM
jgi:hypothetical protein